MNLSVEHVQVGYEPSKPILSDLTFDLHSGKMHCLMGVNGAGKSTLIKSINKFVPVLGGQVRLGGSSMAEVSLEDQAAIVSVVLTDRIDPGHLRVNELLTMGRYPFTGMLGKLRIEDETLIESAIERAGVKDLLEKPVAELSDGQRQKCMICRALVQNTPVIILDEPTTHLDLNNRVEIMRLLRAEARSGKLILMATHEIDLALQFADNLLLIHDGKISQGIPEDLVLSGELDQLFELKGYDLKTGRVQFEPDRDVAVSLVGEGYRLLWVKNALERNGFLVGESDLTVEITADQFVTGSETFQTISALVNHLITSTSS